MFSKESKNSTAGLLLVAVLILVLFIFAWVVKGNVYWGLLTAFFLIFRMYLSELLKVGLMAIKKSVLDMNFVESVYFYSLVLFVVSGWIGFLYMIVTQKTPFLNISLFKAHLLLLSMAVGSIFLDLAYYLLRKKGHSFLQRS